ncbi:MAG: LysR family transcriptional regulator [Verrucomicrobia bacterium]|nr:LysR family transcriptional regulator [Verrucomicrobiota bacterium]
MTIDLRWLQSFLAAAEELNFSRAARRLHLAQPALTAHIRQLEEAVDAQLFDRSNRIHGLTPAGKVLLGEAQAVVARAQGLKEIAMRAQNGEAGTLRLGIIPPAAVSAIANVLREFTRKFPLVTLSVWQNDQQRLVQMLLDKDLDLVLGRSCSGRKLSGLRQRRLFIEEQGIVLREDDPLAEHGRIPIAKLEGTVLLLLHDNPHFGQNIMELAARQRVKLFPRRVVDDFLSLYWAVRSGLGVAPCSLLLIDSLPHGLVGRPLRPAPPRLPVHALWLARQPVPGVGRLLEMLVDQVARPSSDHPALTAKSAGDQP